MVPLELDESRQKSNRSKGHSTCTSPGELIRAGAESFAIASCARLFAPRVSASVFPLFIIFLFWHDSRNSLTQSGFFFFYFLFSYARLFVTIWFGWDDSNRLDTVNKRTHCTIMSHLVGHFYLHSRNIIQPLSRRCPSSFVTPGQSLDDQFIQCHLYTSLEHVGLLHHSEIDSSRRQIF